MTPAALLAEVTRRGVVLRPGAGGLILARPRGVLPEELRAEILANRAEILALLTAPLGPWPSCSSCDRGSGWKTSAEDPALRCPCGTPRPDPAPDPRCVRCLTALADPGDLLCPACYAPGRRAEVATFTEPHPGPVAAVGIEHGSPAPAPPQAQAGFPAPEEARP